MKTIQYVIIAVLIGFFTLSMTACKKEGCTDETAINYDPEAKKDDGNCEFEAEPEITFEVSSPEAHKTFNMGDTIHIEAMYETTGEVHGYAVRIINNSNNDEIVFSVEEHAHDSPVHIHEMWVNNVADHSDMTLEVEISTDHDGGSEVKTVGFHCMPM